MSRVTDQEAGTWEVQAPPTSPGHTVSCKRPQPLGVTSGPFLIRGLWVCGLTGVRAWAGTRVCLWGLKPDLCLPDLSVCRSPEPAGHSPILPRGPCGPLTPPTPARGLCPPRALVSPTHRGLWEAVGLSQGRAGCGVPRGSSALRLCGTLGTSVISTSASGGHRCVRLSAPCQPTRQPRKQLAPPPARRLAPKARAAGWCAVLTAHSAPIHTLPPDF